MSDACVLVDYGCGNLFSIQKRLEGLAVDLTISNQPEVIAQAQKVILPGVGHFGKAMANLRSLELIPALHHCALQRKVPILGICLGFQLMARHSQEGNCPGLGWLEADVVGLEFTPSQRFKVPHTGWNQVRCKRPARLWQGIPDLSEFYFVHSYHWRSHRGVEVVGETDYGITFPSAVEHNNLFGVQFHPEKSHDPGEILLRNFCEA